MQNRSQLSSKVKELYPAPISDAEAFEAAGRLVSFFKILGDIDKQQKQKEIKNDT